MGYLIRRTESIFKGVNSQKVPLRRSECMHSMFGSILGDTAHGHGSIVQVAMMMRTLLNFLHFTCGGSIKILHWDCEFTEGACIC